VSIILEWRHFSSGVIAEFTNRVNLDGRNVSLTENAEELTVGGSTLTIEDPNGDFETFLGHSYIRVRESEAPDEGILWAGFATIREIHRGDSYRTGAARQWVATLDDVNTVIARRILSEDDDADRPAETDVERIQWLFDHAFLGPDDTYFNTGNPVDMDAANCVGTTPYDVVNDCMLQSGKNSFQQDITLGPDDYTGTTFYDFASGTAMSSDLQISNYADDITAEVGRPSPSGEAQTWAASVDTNMKRDPTRIYWKVRGQYDGGTVTRKRLATTVEFAARETTASWPLVKTAAKANARADRYLLDISTEEDVITTTILVHPAHVNDARAGRRIQARFSHLPGYEEWTWMRILNRTVTFLTGDNVYEIQYTLSPGSTATPAGSCTTAVVEAPATVFDSGNDPQLGLPYNFDPDDPPTVPSVVFGAYWSRNHTGAYGTGPIANSIGGAFTQIDSTRTDWTGAFSSFGVAAYQAVSGSTGTMTVLATGFSGDAFHTRALAVSVATAETSPLHAGSQSGSGGTVTLDGTPTAGNLLVGVRFVEGGGVGDSGWQVGWSIIDEQVIYVGTGSVMLCSIAMMCVVEGEDATILVGDSAFSHWTFLTEWAIT
jgi:hypothetical protein